MKDNDKPNESNDTLYAVGKRFVRRSLWGLTYYPLVLLLALVLITIHVVERWGMGAWVLAVSILLFGLACLDRCSRLGKPREPREKRPLGLHPTLVSLLCMFAIAGAYGGLHQRARSHAQRQSQAWRAATATLAPASAMAVSTWQPIAVRAVIEETLRYRRSTTPRVPHAVGIEADDASRDAAENQSELHWQTLTRVRITQSRHADAWRSSEAMASLVIDDKIRGYYPGDLIELYGHWRLPPEPSNPGQFDLAARYAELGWAAQLRAESGQQIRRVRTAAYLRVDRPLAMLVQYALNTVERYVPFGQASLTAALVLGQREQAHWELQEELLATGTIHMLSISGMHIDMVAVALIVCGMMLRLPRAPTLIGTVMICGLYALLCGLNPPVARATLMLSAVCLARLLRWPFTSMNILAAAALILLIQRTSIAFEIGTQLSFLTVAVLILTFPILHQRQTPLQRLLESRQSRGQMIAGGVRRFAWESLRSSFWVCFLSAPLVWSSFHILSPVAVLLNLVLWLPMLVALLSGLALIVLGWIPPVAAMLGMLCGASLWILTQSVALAQAIPMSHFWRAAPPGWWLAGFYAIALAIAMWWGTRRTSARRLLWRSLAAWFALGLAWEPIMQWIEPGSGNHRRGSLAVTWIDVGHGTCAAIETPNGEFWLYDAGRLGDHERSYQPIANALWHLGHSRIDRMILSHADADHYNAMPGIAKRFFPRALATTKPVLASDNPTLANLLDQLRRGHTQIETWATGHRYAGRGGWEIQALHPNSEQVTAPKWSDNAKSLCLAIRFAGRTILLPGDLEPPGTHALVGQTPIPCDVMMAPHHGSLSAQAQRVIAWAQPQWVVVSGSARAVSQRVIEALTPESGDLLITARDRAIRAEIDASGNMRLMQWRPSGWSEIHPSAPKPNAQNPLSWSLSVPPHSPPP